MTEECHSPAQQWQVTRSVQWPQRLFLILRSKNTQKGTWPACALGGFDFLLIPCATACSAATTRRDIWSRTNRHRQVAASAPRNAACLVLIKHNDLPCCETYELLWQEGSVCFAFAEWSARLKSSASTHAHLQRHHCVTVWQVNTDPRAWYTIGEWCCTMWLQTIQDGHGGGHLVFIRKEQEKQKPSEISELNALFQMRLRNWRPDATRRDPTHRDGLNVGAHWLNGAIHTARIKASYSQSVVAVEPVSPDLRPGVAPSSQRSSAVSCVGLSRRAVMAASRLELFRLRVLPPRPCAAVTWARSSRTAGTGYRPRTPRRSKRAGPSIPKTPSNWTRRLPLIGVSQSGGANQPRLLSVICVRNFFLSKGDILIF